MNEDFLLCFLAVATTLFICVMWESSKIIYSYCEEMTFSKSFILRIAGRIDCLITKINSFFIAHIYPLIIETGKEKAITLNTCLNCLSLASFIIKHLLHKKRKLDTHWIQIKSVPYWFKKKTLGIYKTLYKDKKTNIFIRWRSSKQLYNRFLHSNSTFSVS